MLNTIDVQISLNWKLSLVKLSISSLLSAKNMQISLVEKLRDIKFNFSLGIPLI